MIRQFRIIVFRNTHNPIVENIDQTSWRKWILHFKKNYKAINNNSLNFKCRIQRKSSEKYFSSATFLILNSTFDEIWSYQARQWKHHGWNIQLRQNIVPPKFFSFSRNPNRLRILNLFNVSAILLLHLFIHYFNVIKVNAQQFMTGQCRSKKFRNEVFLVI